jgi:hypothetical protein
MKLSRAGATVSGAAGGQTAFTLTLFGAPHDRELQITIRYRSE